MKVASWEWSIYQYATPGCSFNKSNCTCCALSGKVVCFFVNWVKMSLILDMADTPFAYRTPASQRNLLNFAQHDSEHWERAETGWGRKSAGSSFQEIKLRNEEKSKCWTVKFWIHKASTTEFRIKERDIKLIDCSYILPPHFERVKIEPNWRMAKRANNKKN